MGLIESILEICEPMFGFLEDNFNYILIAGAVLLMVFTLYSCGMVRI